jgi:hypothetical protein
MRETQSKAFLRTPGIEALYSGEAMTNASFACRRLRSSSAAAGKPFSTWTSALYEGQSNSAIEPRSTVPPFASTASAASPARRVFREPERRDAEKTRKRTGSREALSIMAACSLTNAA